MGKQQIMTGNSEEKRKRAQQARELLSVLAARYPACFTRDAKTIRPLAIGIQQKLRAEIKADPAVQDTPGWLLRQALATYTRSPAYLNAIIERRPRIHLDGSTAGEVTDQEHAHSLERLEQQRARRAASRPARHPTPPRKESSQESTQRKLELLAKKYTKK
jgi:ProP effector